jgi:hypothetical protein
VSAIHASVVNASEVLIKGFSSLAPLAIERAGSCGARRRSKEKEVHKFCETFSHIFTPTVFVFSFVRYALCMCVLAAIPFIGRRLQYAESVERE